MFSYFRVVKGRREVLAEHYISRIKDIILMEIQREADAEIQRLPLA